LILYIHGFGGNGLGSKARVFREFFQSRKIPYFAPSLSYIPELAVSTLEEAIETFLVYDDVHLIGSSLGGYYALYLAKKYNLKATLINPAIYPYITLKDKEPISFFDGTKYEWTQSHIEKLKAYEIDDASSLSIMLLTQKGDELLDYKEGVDKLQNAKVIVEEGGSHSFDGVERCFGDICGFFGINLC